MRLALLDDYQGVALSLGDWQRLAPAVTVDALDGPIGDIDRVAERLAPYDAILAMRERTPFPAALFARLPRLRLLVTAGMANAAIDLEAAAAHGVQVCGTRSWPHATPELTLGLMLALVRHIPREALGMRTGRWQETVGVGLHGRTLGLIGLGTIGSRMAAFGQVLGMKVIAWSANLTDEKAAAAGAIRVDKEDLLAAADVVSIHLRLSERSRGLIGARELGLMKPTAYLINTSRGPIVDEAALVAHLQAGRIAGAGLDVFDLEPLPADHPLRSLDNAVLLPHLGYVVEENYRLIYADTIEAVEGFQAGTPVRPLNAPRGA